MDKDPFSLNVIGVTDLVQNRTNKTDEGALNELEGAQAEKRDAFSLDMEDSELLALRDKWEKDYAGYETRINRIAEKNLESYLGKNVYGQWIAGENPIAANLQFEAEETFLSATLAKNPEPVVYTDNTPEGNAVAGAVKTMLSFHADQLVLRRKLSLMVRQWSIFHLAVLKPGWNARINDVSIENRQIKNFVFDPKGYVDAYGDFTSYLGERVEVTAEKLIELFPKHKADILAKVEGQLGTSCTYTEWWTDEFCFITFKSIVLDKFKNPYFRYPEPQVDTMGNPMSDSLGGAFEKDPRNHFAYPKKPYIFLSVYSLQQQPHDITGLIEQNIPNQLRISKQTNQVDDNISSSINGYAYSEDNFNQETAKQAANARKVGNPILIPSGGPIDRAIYPLPAQSLPSGLLESLEIDKANLRTSWGVQGITAVPQDEDQTARGMILNQSHDTSRIGGGIGEAIEQVADSAFNWLTQLYYVFYDEKHFASIMGNLRAVEFEAFSAADLDRQIIVSVAPDSMRPKDEVTTMNLAQALFDKGAIGPKTLLKMLDFPDPDNSAADGVFYKIDPMAYFMTNWPDFAKKLQEAQQVQAQLQMANQAQSAAMNARASQAPEATTEPEGQLSSEPASASLSQVPL